VTSPGGPCGRNSNGRGRASIHPPAVYRLENAMRAVERIGRTTNATTFWVSTSHAAGCAGLTDPPCVSPMTPARSNGSTKRWISPFDLRLLAVSCAGLPPVRTKGWFSDQRLGLAQKSLDFLIACHPGAYGLT
jgi:hypothetical protein